MTIRTAAALAATALAVALGACQPATTTTAPAVSAAVQRVVDGDTIVIDRAGREETVRLTGVDAPETVKPGAPVDCYGPQASQRTHRLLDGQKVTVRNDQERRDHFGRLLAYVWRARDGRFIQGDLVAGGYARTLRVEPNTRHAERLDRLQAKARAARRGLWRACMP